MLHLSSHAYATIIGHAYDGLPDESCGLLLGHASRSVAPTYWPCRNVAKSAKVYRIGPTDYLDADDAAAEAGQSIIGVVHSHTHTDPYPSPTDVDAAPDPSWHYVIVSLRDTAPMMRSYRIIDGTITEEPIVVDR